MKAAVLLVTLLYCTAISGTALVYDYIVIGGGTGGSAAAKRLSDPSANDRFGRGPSVLVLEAGTNQLNNPNTINFKNAYMLQNQPAYGFTYLGEGVPALGGVRIGYIPARMWGGTSNINGCLWVRGNSYDSAVYEKYGGPAWSFDNNVATWKTLENFTATTNDPSFHGYNGEIDIVSQAPSPTPVFQEFTAAVQQVFPGLSINPDYNGPVQAGIIPSWQSTFQNLSSGYVRESAATAFLQKNVDSNGDGLGTRDLTIISDALVTRLIFDNAGTVLAVEYIDAHGLVQIVGVLRDVILAAGTVGTPQILLRSGVGDCNTLAGLGITCVVNSPYVGQNVQDHALLQLIFQVPADLVSTVKGFNNNPDSAGFIFGGFAYSPYAPLFSDPTVGMVSPDVELNWKVTSLEGEDINQIFGLDNFNSATNQARNPPIISLSIFQPRPQCYGYVNLTNASPTYQPQTYFCFAEDTKLNGTSLDMAFYRWAMKASLQMVENMQESDPGWLPVFPTPAMINDPVELDNVIRGTFLSGYHPVGSARMGSFDNVQKGVVDGGSLCVHGTTNVRVADNSIYPAPPTGNTQAWAYLAGARVAEFALAGRCPGSFQSGW